MLTRLIRQGALTVCLLSACGGPPTALVPDAGGADPDSGRRTLDAALGGTEVAAGDLTVDLCGAVSVLGSVTIPAGSEVTVCAGSVVQIARDATFRVEGTLRLNGTEAAHVQINGERRWSGLVVAGTLEADFSEIYDANTAILGEAGSSIRFDDGLLYARALASLDLANGGRFDRTSIVEGTSIRVTGGTLTMNDSVVDFDHPRDSPDCIVFSGGTPVLDHVRVSNCHCPLHINRLDGAMQITNSIFDGAAYSMMVASSQGTFTGNVLDASQALIQDIGEGIELDISGNFYASASPVLDSDDETQFSGADAPLATRPTDAGPR